MKPAPTPRRGLFSRPLLLSTLLPVLLVGPYYLFDGERLELNDQIRAAQPGGYIELVDGLVHYELKGPADAPTVVLVHGFSVPSFIWDHNYQALVNSGYQVLRYDLYGRGYSDRPRNVAYDADLFDRQLVQLLGALEIKQAVSVVGLSMGGAIAVIFTDRHPDLVRRVVLIDPVGMPLAIPPLARIALWPGVGEYMMSVLGDYVMRSETGKNLYNQELVPEFRRKFASQMRYVGYKNAILSTLRNMPLGELEETYRRVGTLRKPTLLIWGTEDRVIPFKTNERVRAAMPHAVFHPLDGTGHAANYEAPNKVNPLIISFLNDGPRPRRAGQR